MAKLNAYDYNFFQEQYYVLGKSSNDIARELNVSGCSVVRKMRRLGLDLTRMATVNCSNCGKEFPKKWSHVYGKRKMENNYCSSECYSKSKSRQFSGKGNPFYGRKHTEKTKRIISKTNKGKEMPIAVRKKISLALSGENNPHWKNGSAMRCKKDRLRLEYREWRTTVFERDNYTCRKCHIRGVRLHVHHLKNYSEHEGLRFVPINGVTLCESCHKEFHAIYTRKNNTVKQWFKFLSG